MSVKQRQTKQKKLIQFYLKSTKEHPSAEMVYLNVRKEIPNISRGTVYRILKNLKEDNKIQEIPTEISRWDFVNHPHPHFLCKDCNSMYDMEEDDVLIKIKNSKIGKIENYRIIFYGKCNNC